MKTHHPWFLCLFLFAAGCGSESSSPPSMTCIPGINCPEDERSSDTVDVEEPTDSSTDATDSTLADTPEEDIEVTTVRDDEGDISEEWDGNDDLEDGEDALEDVNQPIELAPGECLSSTDCPGLQSCGADGWCESSPLCIDLADCANDLVCDQGLCEAEYAVCAEDEDCAAGRCDPTLHLCVSVDPCVVESDCAGGEVCSDGTCVACTLDEQCSGDQTFCIDNACIDPPSCGAATDCLEGKMCVLGECAFPGVEPDEFEPNNVASVATEVETIFNNQQLSLSEGDVDHFLVTVPGGHAWAAHFTFPEDGGIRRLELWDESLTYIYAVSESAHSSHSLFVPTGESNRSIRLIIRAVTGIATEYTVSTTMPFKDVCKNDPIEGPDGNDQPGNATPLEASTEKSPSGVVCGGESDWLSWELASGDMLVAGISYPPNAGTLEVRLFDSNIGLVASGEGEAGHLTLVASELAGGTYFVQILSPDENNVPYVLNANSFALESCVLDELEFNDAAVYASEMEEGNVSLTLCPGEEDWFRVSVPEDSGWIGELTYSNFSTQLVIDLISPTTLQVLTTNAGSAFPKGEVTQSLEWGLIEEDSVFVRIREDSGQNPFTFVPYTLSIQTPPSFCVDDEWEENDTAELATEPPTLLGLFLEAVSCDSDLDWYWIPMNTPQDVLSIDLLATGNAPAPNLLLLEEDGTTAFGGTTVESVGSAGYHAVVDGSSVLPEASGVFALVTGGVSSPYQLTTHIFTAFEPCLPDGWEPNNTLLGALPLPEEGSIETAFCLGNPDFFEVPETWGDTGGTVIVELPENNKSTTVLWINQKGELLDSWSLTESAQIPLVSIPGSEDRTFLQLFSSFSTPYTLVVGD